MGSVLLYHLWPHRLAGGFVGVDVFFVISGFLIGSHLLAEVEATGRVRLGRFWARRAKRLLPASLLVLLVVTVATLLVAPLSLRAGFLEQVLGSTLYVQNWVLAAASVDYLAADDAVSPVQHYWSLSAEEQFYVALPLLLAAVALATRARPAVRRRTTVVVIAALTLASLAYSVVLTTTDPGLAYFSTGTRAWEFLAGVLLGCAGSWRLRAAARTLLGTVGLALIVLACVWISDASPFPGWRAGVPVLGAVLVIAAGDAGAMAWASRWRPVTWVGDISYAVYLWHWPLIVLLPYATGHPLTTLDKLGIGLVSLLVAWASTRWFELPVRTSPRLLGGARRARVVGAVCLAATLVVAGVAVGASHASTREQDRLAAAAEAALRDGDVRCLGAAALDPAVTDCPDLGDLLVPAPSSAGEDDGNRSECWAPFGVTDPQVCSFGPDDAPVRVLAVGDSHSNSLIPAYEELAERTGWHVDVTGRAGCTWGTRPQGNKTKTLKTECATWKANIADLLASRAPYDVILTTALQSGDPAVTEGDETPQQATVTGLSEAWASQIARGTELIAIQDNPAARSDVVECVERDGLAAARTCAQPLARATRSYDFIAAAVRATPGAVMISARDLLCLRGTCPPVIGHVVVYRDRTHLTGTFVKTLAPYLVDRIVAAVEAP